uniref:Secreted protein n=1 Tax=Romanomermis culicivorax TaxID=13658 RepID=A0A915I683_ROMCU
MGASIDISWSVSLRNSLICVAVPIKSAVVVCSGGADASVDGSSFDMLRSKISVSRSSSSTGSKACVKIGQWRSSFMVSICAEAVISNG